MPRNGQGTYVLPAGNPVVSGTLITSVWGNTTLSDIAAALTLSLPRDGQVGMTNDLPMGGNEIKGLGGGSLTLPAIRFQGDTDTGMWHEEPGKLALVVDGVEVISMTSTSVTINGETTFGGTVIVPPYLIQNAGVL